MGYWYVQVYAKFFFYEFDDFALGDDLRFGHTKKQPETENSVELHVFKGIYVTFLSQQV